MKEKDNLPELLDGLEKAIDEGKFDGHMSKEDIARMKELAKELRNYV